MYLINLEILIFCQRTIKLTVTKALRKIPTDLKGSER